MYVKKCAKLFILLILAIAPFPAFHPRQHHSSTCKNDWPKDRHQSCGDRLAAGGDRNT